MDYIEMNAIVTVVVVQWISYTYFATGLWNKLWFPSPHGNCFRRMRKCSYATNSSRGCSACSLWAKYAFNMPNATAGNPMKYVNRLHKTTLAEAKTKNKKKNNAKKSWNCDFYIPKHFNQISHLYLDRTKKQST